MNCTWLGLWPAEQEGQAASPGGWAPAGSGGGPGGSLRVHSRRRHKDDPAGQRMQVNMAYIVYVCVMG